MSRIEPSCNKIVGRIGLWLGLTAALAGRSAEPLLPVTVSGQPPGGAQRIVVVRDDQATEAFVPRPGRVATMFGRGLTNLTRQATLPGAWLSLVSTQDVIGLKVVSAPGPVAGTRPAVVEAVVRSLLAVPIAASNIVIWDKEAADLKEAGYFQLGRQLGVEVAGAANAGYDEKVFYEKPFIGYLVYGDHEFGKKTEGTGRKSFVSNLLTKRLTRVVNVSPMLNHNTAGVYGNLFSVAIGSVDNTLRFEHAFSRLTEAVPEIYALEAVGDRVVLNVVDALLCQYQGESQSMLHYSAVLNELRLSKDPVALDVLSLKEIDRQRNAAGMGGRASFLELYQAAAELQLGVADESEVPVVHFQ